MSKNISQSFYEAIENLGLSANANKIFHDYLVDVESESVFEDGTCKLLNIVDEYINEVPKVVTTIRKGKILYRARIIDDSHLSKAYGIDIDTDRLIGFNEGNSREAPLGQSYEGRNNILGMSYLYVSDRMETACVEVKPTVRQWVSIAKFKTTEKLRIVDFSHDYYFGRGESRKNNAALGVLFTNIMAQYTNPVIDSSMYRATQILTDHIRKTGVDGIAYRSFYDSIGINYTFFNSSRKNFEFIESKIVMVQSERRTILDINEKNVKSVNTIGGASYNDEFAQEVKNVVRKRIE